MTIFKRGPLFEEIGGNIQEKTKQDRMKKIKKAL